MKWKSQSVSMPMSSAGIIGSSSGEELHGIKVDPRTIILVIVVFAGAIKVASMLLI